MGRGLPLLIGVSRAIACLPLLALGMGCGDDTASEPEAALEIPPVETEGCEVGAYVGVDGTCQSPGVGADSCASGFQWMDGGLCEPTLPEEACPAGMMAIPGEVECRSVSPCSEEKFGLGPFDVGTSYVDGGYTGSDSDGSESKPWTTISDALDSAATTIAVAEGTYFEDLVVDRAVSIIGRCAGLVEIRGSASGAAAILFLNGASGSRVSDVAVTGSTYGVGALDAGDLSFQRVWIHDTGGRGFDVEVMSGETRAELHDSLVESTTDVGAFSFGAGLSIERSVIRSTTGRGISARGGSALSLTDSVIALNSELGVLVSGSNAELDGVVVEQTQLDPIAGMGRGIAVQVDSDSLLPSNAVVARSVVRGNHDLGIYVSGSTVQIQDSVVRDTLAQDAGFGVIGQDDLASGLAANVSLSRSVVQNSRGFGISVSGSSLSTDGVAIREVAAAAANPSDMLGAWTFSRGINVRAEPTSGLRSTASIANTTIEGVEEVGLFFGGANGEVVNTLVRDVRGLSGSGMLGWGVGIQDSPELGERSVVSLADCAIEVVHQVGIIVLDSDATVRNCRVANVEPRIADGDFGDGLVATSLDAPSSLVVDRVTVEQASRAGVASFGANVSLGGTTLECTPIPLNGEQSAAFENLGGNTCGCLGDETSCTVQSSLLTPPEPITDSGAILP